MTRSGAGNKKLPTCSFFNELSFINDVITNRTTQSNVVINSDEGLQSPTNSCLAEDVEQTPSRTPVRPQNSKKSANSSMQMGIDALILRALTDQPPPQTAPVTPTIPTTPTVDELDPDVLFCKSMIKPLKALSPQKNQYVKMKMQQLLYEAQYSES